MNLSTFLIALLVFSVFAAILIRGIVNRRRGKHSCSCGCASCPGHCACRPDEK